MSHYRIFAGMVVANSAITILKVGLLYKRLVRILSESELVAPGLHFLPHYASFSEEYHNKINYFNGKIDDLDLHGLSWTPTLMW
jgi:hypothetical protein